MYKKKLRHLRRQYIESKPPFVDNIDIYSLYRAINLRGGVSYTIVIAIIAIAKIMIYETVYHREYLFILLYLIC